MATSPANPGVEEPKGTISFSVRLTEKERDLLTRAAEKRGWTLTTLLKSAARERAVHILNTSAPNKVDFRGTAEEVARQVFIPRSARRIFFDGNPVDAQVYKSLGEAFAERQDALVQGEKGFDLENVVEVTPWHQPPEFLASLRDAVRYGGTEFLDLIVQAAEVITSRSKANLPDPIDPSSI